MPMSNHEIVKALDRIEEQIHSQYCALARIRLELQRQWRVLPSGERWTEARQHPVPPDKEGVLP